MKTKIDWCELHAPLFLSGANLGSKLDPTRRQGLVMEYCEVRQHLYVSYNGKTARVPETSVLSMVEAGETLAEKKLADENEACERRFLEASAKKFEAQVSTPQSHVHAGPGAGTTGQEPPKGKGK